MGTTYRSNSSSSSGSGRSRAQQTRARSGSASRTGRSASSSGRRTEYSGNSYTARRGYSSRKRKPSPDYRLIAVAGVLLILVIAAIAYGMTSNPSRSPVDSGEETLMAATETETELVKEVTVDGISITGLSRDEAEAAILEKYPWKMKVTLRDDVYEIGNLMEGKVSALLEEIFSGEPKESYTLDTSGLEEAVSAQVAAMAERWDKEPKNGSISSYDASSDSFLFAGEEAGFAINREKLAADILAAIQAKDFDADITAEGSAVEPEITQAGARDLYKTIGTYTTQTTNNSNRNTNVRLAAEKLNGTIVQPGQELSFNATVGERTEAKGYKSAAAYNNGEVVQEIGGGVCQVSTTLYNAVLRAGLKISRRQSHTFEPSYVTPGMDATVSWGGPDFCFVNTSKAAIGIKASYYDRTMTVSVYGIPVLEDGVTYSLESTKIADTDPPAPTYEEDQTLQPDEEVTVSSGSGGSRWETRLVIKKDGETISREIDHTTTYKGHAPVIRRNTSGVVIGGETETSTETSSQPQEVTPGPQSEPDISQGPGSLTTQPVPETSPQPGPEPSTEAVTPQPAGPVPVSPDAGPGSDYPGGDTPIVAPAPPG